MRTPTLSARKALFVVIGLLLVGPGSPDGFRAFESDAPLIDQAGLRGAYEARKRAGMPEEAWELELAHLFWPAEQQRAAHEVASHASAPARRSYAQMVKRALRPELVPDDLEDRFVGLRKWRFGCDSLLARYAADSRRVQLIISAYGLGVLVVPAADVEAMPADAAYAAKMATELLLRLERFDANRCTARGGAVGRFCFGGLLGHVDRPDLYLPCDVRFVTDGHFVFLMLRPIALEPWRGAGDPVMGRLAPWPPEPKLLFGE